MPETLLPDFRFRVIPQHDHIPSGQNNCAFLNEDRWDDWGKYQTQFYLTVVDAGGVQHRIGHVKIGEFGLQPADIPPPPAPGFRAPGVPREFSSLGESFFSLGQDEKFYENLNKVGPDLRRHILHALKDVALDEALWERAKSEYVTQESLLRGITRTSVEGQFRRIANGGAKLTPYSFGYDGPQVGTDTPLKLGFAVVPESPLPSNVHVLIGRNGVGKTRLLINMTRALLATQSVEQSYGNFIWQFGGRFSNLVSVSFSAFDTTDLVRRSELDESRMKYSYVGLRQDAEITPSAAIPEPTKVGAPKTAKELAQEFVSSLKECKIGERRERWKAALGMLESDAATQTAGMLELIDVDLRVAGAEASVMQIFELLSSGHKIVLLTLTRLVEKVEEQTLVLIDEPEAHLHPPLLSAFIRALSNLLTDRNGVAIVATHSPIVVQEVPRDCVSVLRRVRHESTAERPRTETFGENIGTLTREIFDLELVESGYHQILKQTATSQPSYDHALFILGGSLGAEAKAILRALYLVQSSSSQQ